MFGYRADGSSMQTQVYINVYDLNPSFNKTCFNMGLGFYHTGIQFGSTQYTFAGHDGPTTGIMQVSPKVNHPDFRESILIGKTTLPRHEIHKIIDNLRDKFPGNSYDVIRKNCNTFTNCVCQAIFHKTIPGYINRLANMAKVFYQIDDFIRMRPYNQKYQVSKPKCDKTPLKEQEQPLDEETVIRQFSINDKYILYIFPMHIQYYPEAGKCDDKYKSPYNLNLFPYYRLV